MMSQIAGALVEWSRAPSNKYRRAIPIANSSARRHVLMGGYKMTIKKMLILAASAMALVAFAAPAAASADSWNEEGMFHLTGHLNATVGGTGGPEFTCDVTATVNLFNSEETGEAEGEVESATGAGGTAGCHGIFGGGALTCEISEVFLTGGHISVDATTGVHVEEASFLDILPGCAATEKAGAAGDLTGQFSNEDHCIHYADSGDLATIIGGEVVRGLVDGKLCPTEGNLELH